MSGGEGAFLERLFANRPLAGDLVVPIGDDAAVATFAPGLQVVMAADALAEGSHFVRGTDPRLVGRKALAVNLSDFAAMGARPRFALATAALPRGFSVDDAWAMTLGMRALGDQHGVLLAGGDTITHDGGVVLSVTVVGTVEAGRAVLRSGARVGDVIAVTGALGGSLRSGRHLTFDPRVAEGLALAATGPPSAMMDISDGLLLDLARLCAASGVGARLIAEMIPVHADHGCLEQALAEGEDFELLATFPPEVFARVMASWKGPVPLTAIGTITPTGLTLATAGHEVPVAPRGFQHE